jgi:CheY-like chemotaxis protein
MGASLNQRMAPAVGAPTILVVEDNDDTRELYAWTFESGGYRVLAADSAEEALRLLEHERVRVILTDYNLPRTTGVALLHQARKERLLDPATPALICTAHRFVQPPTGVRVLHKPIDPMTLLGEVERALLHAEGKEVA